MHSCIFNSNKISIYVCHKDLPKKYYLFDPYMDPRVHSFFLDQCENYQRLLTDRQDRTRTKKHHSNGPPIWSPNIQAARHPSNPHHMCCGFGAAQTRHTHPPRRTDPSRPHEIHPSPRPGHNLGHFEHSTMLPLCSALLLSGHLRPSPGMATGGS